MRTEPPLARARTDAAALGAQSWRHRRGDAVAAAALIALPVVFFGIPALLGHAVLPGDDLTQNLPLRVLAGREIRAGHLPLFDPYMWSGAPLLAGWNAAAAYPLTWLFAILPGTAAWTLNLIATGAVAGLGMFCFLRALRLASLASFLGALSFAFAGGMPAQVTHFGLVAGLSWLPLALLSILRLSRDLPIASRLGWTAVLGTVIGLVVLAGEPRAIDDACVVIAIYAVWRIARLRRRAIPAAVSVAAGLVLGGCLGAVQWLPGLAAISSSQRGAESMALYSSGSLPVRWLLLTLVPDLLGGSGSLGQPGFFGFYNLTEVTSYVGILPLVAAFALLGRLRWRLPLPEWLVWHVMALVGVALALGGNTPLGNLLFQLPLFGDQRLQSRNILVLDLALAVLLAYWADRPFGQTGQLRIRRLSTETVLGVIPPVAAVMAVTLALTWGRGWVNWVGLDISPSASLVGQLQPWLVPYAVLSAGAAGLVIVGRRLGPRLLSRLIAGFVVIDVLVFTILCVIQVEPDLFNAATGPGAAAAIHATASAGPASPRPAPLRPVAALGYRGRFAIYDPDLLDPAELSGLEPPDTNAVGGGAMPSVQGYSSTVDGGYASATGSHTAEGDGQDTLAPRAVVNGTLDQLDTTVLLTPSAYLITGTGGTGPAPGPPGTGRRDVSAGQHAMWYLGGTIDVTKVVMRDTNARHDMAAGIQIGLTAPDGSTRWFSARAPTRFTLAVTVAQPLASVAVVARTQHARAALGPPSIVAAGGSTFVADGQLQGALVPPHWAFAGFDGPFAIFANHFAQSPLRIEALPGRPVSGAWIGDSSGPPAEPTRATVFSPHGARVIRSVAAIAGWSATWHPRHGPAVPLTIQRDGLIQAVDVPAGWGTVTWSYASPGFPVGRILSLMATALICVCFGLAFLVRRVRKPPALTGAGPGTNCRGGKTGRSGPDW